MATHRSNAQIENGIKMQFVDFLKFRIESIGNLAGIVLRMLSHGPTSLERCKKKDVFMKIASQNEYK